MARRKNKKSSLIIIIIIIALAVSFYMTKNKTSDETAKTVPTEPGTLEAHFIDVGNADSEFIRLPDGKTVLIDAGERESANTVISYIKDLGVSKIDYLIATHPHSDHIGGLAKVVKAFEIGEAFMPDVTHTISDYENFIDALLDKNVKTTKAKDGVKLGNSAQYSAYFVSPMQSEYEDLNNYSAVLKLEYGKTSFLFAGDMEKDVEAEVLKKYGGRLKSNVLKVGHHGSKTSSSTAFLKAVLPDIAVISCGKGNDYGHPHKEALKRLKKYSGEILRTDTNGTVVIKSDGKEIIR